MQKKIKIQVKSIKNRYYFFQKCKPKGTYSEHFTLSSKSFVNIDPINATKSINMQKNELL